MADYDSSYYQDNSQSGDRLALKYYHRFFRRQLKPGPGKTKTILEYGCGVGHLTKRLVEDYTCHALDISDYALKQVNKNAPAAKTTKKIDDIRSGSLDGVIALHVMEHIKKPEDVFKQFHKKLKPGGVLVFVVPNPDGFGHKLKKEEWFGFTDKTHISLFGVDEWLKRVRQSGFRVTKYCGDGMWDVPYWRRVPVVLQKLFFFPPAAVQVFTATGFLPTKLGECLIVVARKDPKPEKA